MAKRKLVKKMTEQTATKILASIGIKKQQQFQALVLDRNEAQVISAALDYSGITEFTGDENGGELRDYTNNVIELRRKLDCISDAVSVVIIVPTD